MAGFIKGGGLRTHPVLEGMVTSAVLEAQRIDTKMKREQHRGGAKHTDNRNGRYKQVSDRQQLLLAQTSFVIARGSVSGVGETLGFNLKNTELGKSKSAFQGLLFISRVHLEHKSLNQKL